MDFMGCLRFYCRTEFQMDSSYYELPITDESEKFHVLEYFQNITPLNIEENIQIQDSVCTLKSGILVLSKQQLPNSKDVFYFCALQPDANEGIGIQEFLYNDYKQNKFFIEKSDSRVDFENFDQFLRYFLNEENYQDAPKSCILEKADSSTVQYTVQSENN